MDSRCNNMEGRAWDVVFTPLDDQDVVAPLFHHKVHHVFQVARVLDQNLFTGLLRAENPHQEHVLAWEEEAKRAG